MNAADRKIKVAVIGNSNSVMRGAFPKLLGEKEFVVTNLSMGATTNILLLDALASHSLESQEYIVVETCVVDALHATAYSQEICARNLTVFVQEITRRGQKLIFLMIPTRIALLEPETNYVERIYLDIAASSNVPVVNLYEVFRKEFGTYDRSAVIHRSRWAPVVTEAFHIPRWAGYDLSWSALRDARYDGNAFAISGFQDHAHISRSMHYVAAELLAMWIRQDARNGMNAPHDLSSEPQVLACRPLADERLASADRAL